MIRKVTDIDIISSIFSNIEENLEKYPPICIILVDEVYVKSLFLCHGGSLFGKGDNNPELLANTVLDIVVKFKRWTNLFMQNDTSL